MARLPRHPKAWLAGFLLWFVVLWILSSMEGPGKIGQPIDHLDKVGHFTYFFAGGGLLCAYFFRLRPEHPDWKSVIPTVIVVVALLGWLDEWHQTFTPGRSGNDPFDWLADTLGAAFGALTLKGYHGKLD